MNNISKVLDNGVEIFNNILQSEGFDTLVEYILTAYKINGDYPRFIFSGVGKNWYICEKVVKTFVSMSLDAQALDCTHALHGDVGMLYGTKPTILFFISKSGSTEEMIKLAKVVSYMRQEGKLNNIVTVGFSLNKCNSEKYSNLFDYIIAPDDNIEVLEFDDRNLIPTMSINIMQQILDYLGVRLFENDSDRVNQYVYNHMSGNNGKSLGGDKILEIL